MTDRRKNGQIRWLFYCAVGCFELGAIIASLVVVHSFRAQEIPKPEPPEITVTSLETPVEPIHAEPLVYVTPETTQTEKQAYGGEERQPNELPQGNSNGGFADERIGSALQTSTPKGVDGNISRMSDEEPEVHVIDSCVVTYYCAERYPHICGTGDGITATGDIVMPGVTCAVDPSVIPYGSIVSVDYGDGVLHEYIAQDAGAWIDGNHIDICVKSHTEALELGRKTATVYWRAPEVKSK